MIALVDCNNFYCSCERMFQLQLIGRALIVLSNNDGCAIARSEEAKALGIGMAQPAFMVEEVIKENNVAVYSSNCTLYESMSRRVMQIIKGIVPRTEVYSIDEIFCDLTGLTYQDLNTFAKELRETVTQSTGIPVSVGVGPTKALAKMANRYAKKTRPDEGVFVADTQPLVNAMLSFTDVGAIWGIGKQHEALLTKHGFLTAIDFVQKAPEEWVKKHLTVKGQRLHKELKGISCFEWEEVKPIRKAICTSKSFGKLITKKSEVAQAVAKFTSSCADKLRREKTCATEIEVFVKTNPHKPEEKQYEQSITLELPQATNLTTELMKHAMKALELIFQPGYKYQKAGVIVKSIVPESTVQLGLFEEAPNEKEKELMKTIDGVNKTFGKDTVRFGVHGYGKAWHLKQSNLSKQYTTRLDYIPKAS